MNQMMLFKEIDSVEAITAESISFLIDNLKDKGEIFVGFSGGKDSICTADLIKKTGLPYKLFYSFTGIDPPEVVRFIRKNYPECVFLKPKKTFWQSLITNVPPSDRIRWCCTLLKKKASWSLPHKLRVFGIRSEEGSRRAKYDRINYKSKMDHTEYYPILSWKEWQVWDYIKDNDLAYPSLYDEGFERLGCVVCPYHSDVTGKKHRVYRDRWPKYFKTFEKHMEILYQKRVLQGKNMNYDSSIDFCNAWYRQKNARWYKKTDTEDASQSQSKLF